MSDLISIIKDIQRHVGAVPDGQFGPVSAGLVLAELRNAQLPFEAEKEKPATVSETVTLDARSEANIATLDPKAQTVMRRFLCLAKATAASMGCDYVAISGARSYKEQAALYERYKAGGPKAAPPGSSWHEYRIAIDCGVFQANGKLYLDAGNATQAALADRVHRSISVHAKECGLEWGGNWTGKSCDPPHWQINLGRSSPNADDKAKLKAGGWKL